MRIIFLLLFIQCNAVHLVWHHNQGVKQPSYRHNFLQAATSKKIKNDDFFEDYRRFDDIIKYIKGLRRKLRSAVKVYSIGKSVEGRCLKVIQIGSNRKPGIFIDGGIHAREWISPATVTYIASKVIDEFHNKTSFIRDFCWYILPVLNPDGYEYSHTTNRLWRKNVNRKNINEKCFGVDLNRNWNYHWKESSNCSEDPCQETYCGKHAFSEPETQAVSNFLLRKIKKQSFISYLSFHSYGQKWLYPWGWTQKKVPSDFRDLVIAAFKATKALRRVNNTTYEVLQASKLSDIAPGGSADWAKGVAGIKYSYSIELSPERESPHQFELPKNLIQSVVKEVWEGVKELANVIRR